MNAELNPTVLFVDDEPLILKMIKRELGNAPFRMLFSESPATALNMVGQERVDVFVSDFRMPAIDGLETLEMVRAVDPNVVRVILTGHADVDVTLRAINEAAVHRFLTKPWAPGALMKELVLCLQHASRLKGAAPRRADLIDGLERTHPGISHLERGPGEAIQIEPSLVDADIGAFLNQLSDSKL